MVFADITTVNLQADGILSRILGTGRDVITADDARDAIECLKHNHGITCDDKVAGIDTEGRYYAMLPEMKAIITEFLNFIPKHVLDVLPEFNVVVDLPPPETCPSIGAWNGECAEMSIHGRIFYDRDMDGTYRSYQDVLNHLRKTVFHEMAHWVHLCGPDWFKAAIQAHFDARTANQPILPLPGYKGQGKDGGFWDPYMGSTNTGDGVEIPTRCAELLADPVGFAERWNNPRHRETMEVFASILK